MAAWHVDAFVWLLKCIYPMKEPDLTRDRPLQVLCLGLSRSGTDSLSKALVRLGYDDCYHGLQVVEYRMSDAPQWYRLAKAKLSGNKDFLCAEQFDKILGHCMAVSDAPCCCFSEELIKCYPEARIVLNKRRDVNAWADSIKGTLFGMYSSWWRNFRALFLTDLFWIRLWTRRLMEPLFTGPLEHNPDNMAETYEKHYEDIKVVCQREGRDYLEWGVEDGWKPLCDFLGKPVPDEPFPAGNSMAQFQEFKSRVQDPRERRAKNNMMLTATTILATSLGILAYYRYRT